MLASSRKQEPDKQYPAKVVLKYSLVLSINDGYIAKRILGNLCRESTSATAYGGRTKERGTVGKTGGTPWLAPGRDSMWMTETHMAPRNARRLEALHETNTEQLSESIGPKARMDALSGRYGEGK